MFCLVASTQSVFDCLWLVFTKGTQGVCRGVEEIGAGFQQRSVAALKVRKEDRVRSVVGGRAIFGPGEPVIHLRCPRVCWWWVCWCSVDEGSRGCIGIGPRMVSGVYNDCFGFGVCELVHRDSFVPWYPQEGCRAWSSIDQ